jgi:hypothetical protein
MRIDQTRHDPTSLDVDQTCALGPVLQNGDFAAGGEDSTATDGNRLTTFDMVTVPELSRMKDQICRHLPGT